MLAGILIHEATEPNDDLDMFEALNAACVASYMGDGDTRPATAILDAFRERNKEPVLARWVTHVINGLDRCPKTVKRFKHQF